MKCVGVLALQGAYAEHFKIIQQCVEVYKYDIEITTVKNESELARCNALIIPGGESTSISLISQRTGIFQALVNFVHDPSKSVWGTCAGLIFLAKNVKNTPELVSTLDVLNVKVVRNAFGRQAQSFIKSCDFSSFIPNCTDFSAVFIRAPIIESILNLESENEDNNIKVLYKLDNGSIVAVSQGNRILATSFHPELAEGDIRFHNWFLTEYVL
ncbi:hypothetical protein C6P41_000198 [Kluyveromyces marxianus]|nr:hypothetical protein C6P43_002721 [Kluyveromyces marxianus]KAG0685384.1 hypothetical protein C6P41_000198 [Kluyveromyces marxianus]